MSKQLPTPLGSWHQWYIESYWRWFYDPVSRQLLHQEGAFYRVYRRCNQGRTRHQQAYYVGQTTESGQMELISQLPLGLELADIRRTHSGKAGIFDSAQYHYVPNTQTSPFHQQVDLAADRHWPLSQVQAPHGKAALVASLIAGTAVAVSDGSFKNGCSTGGGVLFAENFARGSRLSCINKVPGESSIQDAYRAELGAIVGVLTVLQDLCHEYHIINGHITIGLDGSQAMKDASDTWHPPASKAHFDMIRHIRVRLQNLPVTISWRWVKGHQDDLSHQLDLWAQANVMADALAQGFRKHLQATGQADPHHTVVIPAHVCFKSQPLSSIEEDTLYTSIQGPPTIEYWSWKRHIPLHCPVAWDCAGRALRNLPFHQLRRTIKQATGFKGVGAMLARWYPGSDSSCPLCEAPVEDACHVIQCPDPRARKVWEASLTKLDSWMKDQRTNPLLRNALLVGLKSWANGDPCTSRVPAARAQSNIGWYNMILGFASPKWGDSQHAYFQLLQVDRTGNAWLTALLKKLWEVSWDLWEHRNGIKHAPDFATEASLWELQANIRYYYDLGPSALPALDQHHIKDMDLSTLLSKSVADQKRWLNTVEAARSLADHRLDRPDLQAAQAAMHQWLKTANPTL